MVQLSLAVLIKSKDARNSFTKEYFNPCIKVRINNFSLYSNVWIGKSCGQKKIVKYLIWICIQWIVCYGSINFFKMINISLGPGKVLSKWKCRLESSLMYVLSWTIHMSKMLVELYNNSNSCPYTCIGNKKIYICNL